MMRERTIVEEFSRQVNETPDAVAVLDGVKWKFDGERYQVVADMASGYLRIYDKETKTWCELIGAYWDHAPLPQDRISLIPYDPTYYPASSPHCLFDLIEKKRCISIAELLAADSDEQLGVVSDNLDGCDEVAVLLDYQPSAEGSVLCRFYRRRVLQAYGRLSSALPGSNLLFMLPKERRDAA